jgi:SulP family sulfate permease
MPALGAILLVVAYNMSEWRLFLKLFKAPTSDVLVLLTSFLLTVFIDLTVAIEVGFVLSTALFMKRMADVTEIRDVTQTLSEGEDSDDPGAISRRNIPKGVEVFEIQGSFFFGAAEKFKSAIQEASRAPQVLILRMRDMVSLDATGLRAIEEVHDRARREGWTLILSGVHAQPMIALVRSGLADQIGEDNLCGDIDEALLRAGQVQSIRREKKTSAQKVLGG